MSWLFVAKKILSVMLQPPLLPLWLTAAGLLLLRRKPRLGRALAWSGVVLGLLVSTPVSVGWAARELESDPPVSAAELREAQAIVILAGGQVRNAPELGRTSSVNRITLQRVRYGALLARQTGLPVLASGGAPTGVRPEALAMKTALEEYGVSPRWLETESLDTYDNARLSAPMLRAAGVQRIALVSHAAHLPRARREFEVQGFTVYAAPTAYFNQGPNGEEFFDYLPSATTAYAGFYVLHESLGLLAQKLRMLGGTDGGSDGDTNSGNDADAVAR